MESRNTVIRYGKPLDSERLKRGLRKSESITAASNFSRAIQSGNRLVRCPLCDHEERDLIAKVYGFSYVECFGCGSAYVEDPPSAEAISAAYRSDYYTAANRALLANPETINYRLSNVAIPKVSFVLEHCKTGSKRWLDIGCGVGEILAAAQKHGLETLGIETNAMESDFARSHFGLSVVEQYIDASNIHAFKDRFDIVSMFSVLEHIPDPPSLLATISKIQKRGDTLVIETPHFPSISAFSQMAFPDLINRMMHPPLHLFLFSVKVIESMLLAHGYTVRARWMFGQDFYEFLSTLTEKIPLSGSRLQKSLAALTNEFQQTIDNAGLSDEMLVVAERM